MAGYVIYRKARNFAIRAMRMCEVLRQRRTPTTLITQIERSATSISANLAEAQSAVSRADFYNKRIIALKEARESDNWIEILHGINKITPEEFRSIHADCDEVLRFLVATTRTLNFRRTLKTSPPSNGASPNA